MIGTHSPNRQVSVYTRSGGAWKQQQALTIPIAESAEAPIFGDSLAISGDGNTALVGGRAGLPRQPRAWVFTRSGGKWTQQGGRLTPNELDHAAFAAHMSLSEDGSTALLGGEGGAWVFTRSGSSWKQDGNEITPTDEASPSGFGEAVAVSADGSTALIGGPRDSNATGAAWVFARSGETWSQQGSKLTANDEVGKGAFGTSVALSSEGNTGAIGGPGDGANGAVWLFTRRGATWTQQGGKTPGAALGFGSSIALSPDAQAVLIGNPDENGGEGEALPERFVRQTAEPVSVATKAGVCGRTHGRDAERLRRSARRDGKRMPVRIREDLVVRNHSPVHAAPRLRRRSSCCVSALALISARAGHTITASWLRANLATEWEVTKSSLPSHPQRRAS